MFSAKYRLRPLEYGAVTGVFKRLDPEDGPVLDDEQVERLLLEAPLRTSLAAENVPGAVIKIAVDGDALAAMRGLMIGLALTLPVWCVIAATIAMV